MSNNAYQINSEKAGFKAKISLKLYYKIDFLHLIQEFVVESSRAFGAGFEDLSALRLATEEVAVHILENYPDTSLEDHFEITCEPVEQGVQFVFTNMGIPVNIKALPAYDANNPMETDAGLKFFLIDKLVDRFEFINEGNLGWRTVIYKKLDNFKDISKFTGIKSRDAKKYDWNGVEYLKATPQDAPFIVELAYHTYKYSYCKKFFYYIDMLENKLENQQVVSYVAKLQSGSIVGHMALMVSEKCPQIAEFGAAMITPEFRGQKGFLELIGLFHNYMINEEKRIALYHANLVTLHTATQKLAAFFEAVPTALMLSLHERADFRGMADDAPQRESLLFAAYPFETPLEFDLFVPESHLGIAEKIFSSKRFKVNIKNDNIELPDDETTLYIERNRRYGIADITIESFGSDLLDLLSRKIHELCLEKTVTIYLTIPASKPISADIDKELSKLGLFFSGFMPNSPDNWCLYYTYFNFQKFDFSKIKLFDEMAKQLCEYVSNQYQKLLP